MTNPYDDVWSDDASDPAADFEAAEATAAGTRGRVRIRFDLNHVGAQFHYWEQDVDASDLVDATKALEKQAKALEPFFRETFKKPAPQQYSAPAPLPTATGTGADAVRSVASGTATAGGTVVEGPNNVFYVPTSVIPTDQAKALVAAEMQKAIPGVDLNFFSVFDNRGGQYGLENGGTNNYSALVVKLKEGAPGFDQVRTQAGKPAAVASLKWNRDGSTYFALSKPFQAALGFIRSQITTGAPAPAAAPQQTSGDDFF